MTARNWGKDRDRQRMREQGAETIDGVGVIVGAPRKRTSKAALRAELDGATLAAGATVTRIVSCTCGRRATVKLPAARLQARLRCSACGRVAS